MCMSALRNTRPEETTSFPAADHITSNAQKPRRARVSHKRKHDVHITVQHNYHDHSLETETAADFAEEIRGGASSPFPIKLHEMLERVEADGNAHIVSWQPHGRCFVVHKPELFKAILPQYFKLSKIASFQRQLNLYGFQRLTRGLDKGGYYHELFVRGRAFLSHRIQRVKVKGTGVRARSNPEQEPDLWSMAWMASTLQEQTLMRKSASSVISMDDSDTATPINPLSEQDADVMQSWGKTFHYLDLVHPSVTEELMLPQVVSSQPATAALESPVDLSGMGELLDSVDFDELVHEIFDDNNLNFADMLDMVVQ